MKELTSQEIKEMELNILIEFDKFCKENNLTYFLAAGTLLGAIRHKGFIPWDDDIDVFMPRPEYEKFKQLTRNTPIADHLFTYCYDIPDHTINYPFIKVLDNRTLVKEKAVVKGYMGIWLDVFPLDGLASSELKRVKQFKKNKSNMRSFRLRTNDSSYTNDIFRKLLCSIVGPFFKKLDILKFCKKFDHFAKEYDYDKSEYVGEVLWGYGPQETMKKSGLVPIKVEFEGHMFPAPACYDKYLTNLYGDYMILPPENERIIHGFKAYLIEDNTK